MRQYLPGTPKAFLLLELTLAMLIISVALLGLLEGYRAALEARRANDLSTQLRYLLEQKLAEIESAGRFAKGEQVGSFTDQPQFKWKVETDETSLAGLFRIKATITSFETSLSSALYLRAKDSN